MAFLETERDGDLEIGSAFHVGDGVFITARHVVGGRSIRKIVVSDQDLFYRSEFFPKQPDGSFLIGPKSSRMCRSPSGRVTFRDGPFFYRNERVDVAAFRVNGMMPNAHYVPFGIHLDDWVGRYDFQLSEALVFGYPPVPLTTEPVLVVATAQVNAVVDLKMLGDEQLHFILSAMPRGGFSGGLVYSRWGFMLGVITRSLTRDYAATELGSFSCVSIQAILDCLGTNRIVPPTQDAILAPMLLVDTLNDP